MQLPDYVTKDEVRRVCTELHIRDWSQLTAADVSSEEASTILAEVNTMGMSIPVEEFRRGLEVELEHGTRYSDANVTNNHPVLTGKIVLAHMKETLDYYRRLEVAELEGDVLKALVTNDFQKAAAAYGKLAAAKRNLRQAEAEVLAQVEALRKPPL